MRNDCVAIAQRFCSDRLAITLRSTRCAFTDGQSLRKPSTITVNRFAIASQSLRNPYATALQSLRRRNTYTGKSKHIRCAIATQKLRNHIAISLRSLHDRSAIATQSLRNRCAISAQSLRNHCAITAQSTRYRIAIQSLWHCCVSALRSRCNGPTAAKLLQISAESLFN